MDWRWSWLFFYYIYYDWSTEFLYGYFWGSGRKFYCEILWFISTECISLNTSCNLNQSVGPSCISFSTLYLSSSLLLLTGLTLSTKLYISFLSYLNWLFSLLCGMRHFFYISLLFLFLFCIYHKILKKQGGLTVWEFSFLWAIFLHVVWVFFLPHLPHTWCPQQASLWWQYV